MLEMKYEMDDVIATDYMVPVRNGTAETGDDLFGTVCESMIAARGSNGLYAIRTGKIAVTNDGVQVFNPFSTVHKLTDIFGGHADYKLTPGEAVQELKWHQEVNEKRISSYGTPKGATHVSAIPEAVVDQISPPAL